MTFFSRSSRPVSTPSPAGTRFYPDYKRKLQEDGTFILEAAGEIDLYAHIQALAGGLDVYSLIDTYRRTGDPSVISNQKGAYIDVTNHPRTLAELEQFRLDSRDAFYSLPVAVRDLFGHSFEAFIRDPEKAMAVLAELEKKPRGVVNPGAAGAASAATEPAPAPEQHSGGNN